MNPKTLFLSAFFLFASALCLQAQGTYEYATVSYNQTDRNNRYIAISMNDNYTETEVKPKFKPTFSYDDLTPLLNKVNELALQGWEVYSTYVIGGAFTYHLRRKKT